MKKISGTDVEKLVTDLLDAKTNPELTNQAARILMAQNAILEGFLKSAQRMGMGDIYTILRTNIENEDSPEAAAINKALDFLEDNGMKVSNDALDRILAS